ncbi:MAG: deoxyribonuclease V [Nitrospinales bacterium]
MKIKPLHSWEVSPRDAVQLQKRLAGKVKTAARRKLPKIVAGADIGFARDSSAAFAGVVLLAFPSLRVVGKFIHVGEIKFPYVPGLLSFREAPILLELFGKIDPAPDLIFFDGHGLAHPRRLGLASHLGLFLNRPTIGCAKSKLIGVYDEPEGAKGSFTHLLDEQNRVLGAAVRSRRGCKPIFVSVGHKIGLSQAIEWTLQCTTRYRIPEPTRLAHNLVTEYRKSRSS